MKCSTSADRDALARFETIDRNTSRPIAAPWLSRSSTDISTDEKGD